MSEQEIADLETKLEQGLLIAEKRMLQEKALHDETVVTQSLDGEIRYISAKQVIEENAIFQ